jgi:hypothetical protein
MIMVVVLVVVVVVVVEVVVVIVVGAGVVKRRIGSPCERATRQQPLRRRGMPAGIQALRVWPRTCRRMI